MASISSLRSAIETSDDEEGDKKEHYVFPWVGVHACEEKMRVCLFVYVFKTIWNGTATDRWCDILVG